MQSSQRGFLISFIVFLCTIIRMVCPCSMAIFMPARTFIIVNDPTTCFLVQTSVGHGQKDDILFDCFTAFWEEKMYISQQTYHSQKINIFTCLNISQQTRTWQRTLALFPYTKTTKLKNSVEILKQVSSPYFFSFIYWLFFSTETKY